MHGTVGGKFQHGQPEQEGTEAIGLKSFLHWSVTCLLIIKSHTDHKMAAVPLRIL